MPNEKVSPPGWYPDPQGGGQRYWDGDQWTEQRAPARTVIPWWIQAILIVAAVFVVLIFLF